MFGLRTTSRRTSLGHARSRDDNVGTRGSNENAPRAEEVVTGWQVLRGEQEQLDTIQSHLAVRSYEIK